MVLFPIPISIDTYKAEVARQALEAGASIINDISALRFDAEMIPLAAEAKVPVILMHMKGTPTEMQDNPVYDDLIPEMMAFFRDIIKLAVAGALDEKMLIIDPGIGFGKTFDHNLQVIDGLDQFRSLNRPILLGSSRKAFIGHILGNEPLERDTGTMATVAAGVMNGAHIVRVHNVANTIAVRLGIIFKISAQETLPVAWCRAVITAQFIGVRGAQFTLHFPQQV